MEPYYFLAIIGSIFIFYTLYILYEKNNIRELEAVMTEIFKKRNNQAVNIYYASKPFINKHSEVFQHYIELKKQNFSELLLGYSFENRILSYKKIHKEINFLFKICEMNTELKKHPIYNYTKDSIIYKSHIIGEKYEEYKESKKTYRKKLFFSKLMLIGFLIGE